MLALLFILLIELNVGLISLTTPLCVIILDAAPANLPGRPTRFPTLLTDFARAAAASAAFFAFLLALLAWVISAAAGEAAFTAVTAMLSGWFGLLLLFGFSASFFYHLVNGIRHLGWDAGYGFDKAFARLSGWVSLVVAVALTLLFWLGVFA